VRERAALAIGRIGDKRGVEPLVNTLRKDENESARAMAAFALGEIEDAQAAAALLDVANSSNESAPVRARAVEALGKIAGVQANAEKPGPATLNTISQSLIKQLPTADTTLSADQKLLASLAITALMRLRNPASVEPLAQQLKSKDAEVRAQAANALARLRQPIGSAVPALIEALNDSEANVRANAARALGASKDTRAVEPLVKMLADESDQARANAIRALAAIGDNRAVEPLLVLGQTLYERLNSNPSGDNLLIEIIAALHSLKDDRALPLLRQIRLQQGGGAYPELEVAIARFGEREFFQPSIDKVIRSGLNPRWIANLAQGLGELRTEQSKETLWWLLGAHDQESKESGDEASSVPDILRALAKHKPSTLQFILRTYLSHSDAIVRATAASLIAETVDDQNFSALVAGWIKAESDKSNDAKLAILSALAKYKTPQAVDAVKAALIDRDHLVRRHAVDLLKQMGAGDFSDRIGIVQTGHDKLFYQRVAARLNKKITATIHTAKGQIKLELFPQDAPITVDSFITLARKGYFNNLTFHRVVPNFVIQGGDPRGDGEGGPGYQIRCEINTRPYTRGAVGMALSGKDTGGSQFFITHSPQPHLDGGYTVFGQVTSGMEVVDRIARGDLIKRVEIVETSSRP